ncbi:sulfatase family protein [Bacteroides eggerthii]|uniref:sulfatase family protein n=1 Tax=Bacteroides eggerthii TaxID=28111 RepID=UPI0035677CE7
MNKTICFFVTFYSSAVCMAADEYDHQQPNILFVVADDQSYPYTSAYGSSMVHTPAFDEIASEGCLFSNAYVTCPGSSPSRASILTGRYIWQIEEAGTHASCFPQRYICFPDLLLAEGYHIGYTGKGWAPGDWAYSGRKYNPAGPEYNEHKHTPPYKGISSVDYVGNFKQFYEEKDKTKPFYFWFGAHEPHRVFEKDSWRRNQKQIGNAEIPTSLPDHPVVAGDVLDYAVEIEWYDKQLLKMINFLKEKGEWDNTIVVVTADNGMSFPGSKATCYDSGIHVPLAIRWKGHIPSKRISDLVSTVDLMPTLLEAIGIQAELDFPMTGLSMLSWLTGKTNIPPRNAIFAGRERHSCARWGNKGYPIRAIRWENYLYIRNYQPNYWPAGDPLYYCGDSLKTAFWDIDTSPSKQFLIDYATDAEIKPFYLKAMGKRPSEELYNVEKDPGCMYNLTQDSRYQIVLSNVRELLKNELIRTNDQRTINNNYESVWESYPRLKGPMRKFPQ